MTRPLSRPMMIARPIRTIISSTPYTFRFSPPLTNHSLHLCRPVVYKYKKIPSYHNVARPKTVRSIAGNLERLLDARFVPQEVCWTIMKGTWKLAQYAVSGTALSGFVVIDLDYTTGLNIGFDNGEEDARRGKDDG